ncbi:PaaI family thioesterase [Salinisphaera sp. Q1T1-3]|nr:PaaI family thioesterase [Salinisphaera sp. Q1T1-3]
MIAAVPYARYLGLIVRTDAPGRRAYVMPYRDAHIGNASLPALHGGTLAALLELAMQFEALIDTPAPRLPDPVDFTIDYWRSAGPAECIASARLIRAGRHVAQVQAQCWQDNPDRPIAFARATFVLREASAAT